MYIYNIHGVIAPTVCASMHGPCLVYILSYLAYMHQCCIQDRCYKTLLHCQPYNYIIYRIYIHSWVSVTQPPIWWSYTVRPPNRAQNSGGCNPPNLVDNTGAAMQYWHVGFMLIQKPGKPIGALSSLRPIVLLTTLRKVLSLVVLARISSKVNSYLSAGQSGFRHGRSTADIMLVTAGWPTHFVCRPGLDSNI